MLESLLLSMLLPLQQPYGHATVCVGHLIYDTFSLNLWYSLAWTRLLIRWSRGGYSLLNCCIWGIASLVSGVTDDQWKPFLCS